MNLNEVILLVIKPGGTLELKWLRLGNDWVGVTIPPGILTRLFGKKEVWEV
jgi:hypothetical protein